MNTKNYALCKRDTLVVPFNANTTNSTYAVKEYTPLRFFATRSAARAAKQAYKTPRNYSIVNVVGNKVVR